MPGPGLVLLYAPEIGRVPSTVPIPDTGAIVLGREPPEDGVTLFGDSVSRQHATLSRTTRPTGLAAIADLGSRNGLILNGALVRKAELRAGDELRIGDALFKVVADDLERFAAFHPGSVDPAAEALSLVGGARMAVLREQVATVAKTARPVLLFGHKGTGKAVTARAIHRSSGRTGAFTTLHCATLPGNPIEGQLVALAHAADRGTLYLEGVADLPLDEQAKLLRLIDSGELGPVGEGAVRVDVQIVASTPRDLHPVVAEGRLDKTLFARLAATTLDVPSLRVRKEDLYPLARVFLARQGRADAALGADVMAALVHYSWPGNVRELENVIRRCVALAAGGEIVESHLPSTLLDAMMNYGEAPSTTAPSSRGDWPAGIAGRPRGRPGIDVLRDMLIKHAGSVDGVAAELRQERALVYRWIRQQGLEPDHYRTEPVPDESGTSLGGYNRK